MEDSVLVPVMLYINFWDEFLPIDLEMTLVWRQIKDLKLPRWAGMVGQILPAII